MIGTQLPDGEGLQKRSQPTVLYGDVAVLIAPPKIAPLAIKCLDDE